MTKTPLTIQDQLMSLRARSWRLSRKEDDLLDQIHSTILWRSEVDSQIDALEKRIENWRKK